MAYGTLIDIAEMCRSREDRLKFMAMAAEICTIRLLSRNEAEALTKVYKDEVLSRGHRFSGEVSVSAAYRAENGVQIMRSIGKKHPELSRIFVTESGRMAQITWD